MIVACCCCCWCWCLFIIGQRNACDDDLRKVESNLKTPFALFLLMFMLRGLGLEHMATAQPCLSLWLSLSPPVFVFFSSLSVHTHTTKQAVLPPPFCSVCSPFKIVSAVHVSVLVTLQLGSKGRRVVVSPSIDFLVQLGLLFVVLNVVVLITDSYHSFMYGCCSYLGWLFVIMGI